VDTTTQQTPPAGGVAFSVAVDSSPRVSVPLQVELTNSTRLIFTQWSDGLTQPQRQVLIDGDINLTASYRLQYLLTVNAVTTTEKWYDQGSNATITAQTSPPVPWPLNLFGVTQSFRDWSGDIESTSQQLNITMDSPKTVTANYDTNYQNLAVPVIFGLGLVTAAVSLIFLRRRAGTGEESLVEPTAAAPVPTPSPACPTCGETIEKDWMHCIKCGTKLSNADRPNTVQN